QFHDNVGVFGSQPTLLWYAGGVLGLVASTCLLAWRWSSPGRHTGRVVPAAATVLAIVLVGFSGDLIARQASQLSTSGTWQIGEGLLSRPVLPFFATAALEPRWEVGAADTSAFRSASQKLISPRAKARPADIVVFLQESQFNPATIAGCPKALCTFDAF